MNENITLPQFIPYICDILPSLLPLLNCPLPIKFKFPGLPIYLSSLVTLFKLILLGLTRVNELTGIAHL